MYLNDYINNIPEVESCEIALAFSSKSYDDRSLEIFDEIFNQTIRIELDRLLKIQKNYKTIGEKIVVNNSFPEFFKQLFTVSCPKVLKHNNAIQQMYLLHMLGILLIRYNKSTLHIDPEKFIIDIFIPNLMSACAKHLINARRLIHRSIRNTYEKIESKSHDIMEYIMEMQQIDPSIIRNDILYLFIRNIILQFDPLELQDVEQLYSTVIYRMFYFYLKSKASDETQDKLDKLLNFNDITHFPSQRYQIYVEAIYLAQLKMMCNESNSVQHISDQYNKIRNIIVPNEVQRLYLFSLNKSYQIAHNRVSLIHFNTNYYDTKYLQNHLPMMYRLLKSIHVISETSSFKDNDVAKLNNAIYDTLYNRFKNIINKDVIIPVLKRITENLVNSLVTGEYYDISTLTSISIYGDNFIDQLQKFLNLVLNDIGLSSEETPNG